jgi:hypothetical protein
MESLLWRHRVASGTGLVLAYILAMTAFNIWKPRILVIHSLSESLRQVKETDAGLRQPLIENRLPVSVRWYYLNSDQEPPTNQGRPALIRLQRVIDDFNPTVLVAVDDDANSLLAKDPNLWRGRRLFFLGINRDPSAFGYSTALQATGIRDTPPLQALADLFHEVRPAGGLRIAALGSDNSLSRDLEQGINAHSWGPHRLIFTQRVITLSQWKQVLMRANQQADVLLITSVTGLRHPSANQLVSPMEVVRYTEDNSNKLLPVGLMVDYVPLGGGLGIIPSARYLGNLSMATVLRWLEPAFRSGVPELHVEDHFDVGLREENLRRRGINLPRLYREAARLSGQLFTISPGRNPLRSSNGNDQVKVLAKP